MAALTDRCMVLREREGGRGKERREEGGKEGERAHTLAHLSHAEPMVDNGSLKTEANGQVWDALVGAKHWKSSKYS